MSKIVLHATRRSIAVWGSPDGIGELELFPWFSMQIGDSRTNRLSRRIAFSIPEKMLDDVGYVGHDFGAVASDADFTDRTPVTERNMRGSGVGEVVFAQELIAPEEYIIGRQVIVAPKPHLAVPGRDFKAFSEYVLEGIGATSSDPNNLEKFLNYYGWDKDMATRGVAITVQNAVGTMK